ncbi:MAG TPA: alpha/beta hydrolase [Ferruginibacter sp.]|jgi:acetyl esterase/lipase|nr:alpha/beta hydrolase [Ferruginibacter sp.]
MFKLKADIFLLFTLALGMIFLFSSCAFKSVTRSKDIVYLKADTTTHTSAEKLNVFAPRKHTQLKDVLIFIHGGNWNSGKKGLYSFFGNRFARKGIVTVIIDYPLSPKANYNKMAMDAAIAVKWVKEHIATYGGDPNKIFISGHSAGGHLAALISIDNHYFDTIGIKNPIKGAIFIDAAGLDMYGYLKTEGLPSGHTYFTTFTTDPAIWKQASPMYHLHTGMPPILIYQGEKTYPSIAQSNDRFLTAIKEYVPDQQRHILKRKKHIPMITQFFNPYNKRYKEIIQFMNHTDQ